MRIPRKKRSRRAAAEVMGAILMMAVTLAVGFAVWAWAGSAASSSEKSFGNGIANNISCLNQNFVITNANFSSANTKQVTMWLYNSGNGTVSFASFQVSNSSWLYSNTTSTWKHPTWANATQGTVKSWLFNAGTSFTPGKMYSFKVVGRCYTNTGSIVSTYQQVR